MGHSGLRKGNTLYARVDLVGLLRYVPRCVLVSTLIKRRVSDRIEKGNWFIYGFFRSMCPGNHKKFDKSVRHTDFPLKNPSLHVRIGNPNLTSIACQTNL